MTRRHNAMTAHSSVSFMAWVTVLLILAGVSTCQIAKPIVPAPTVTADVQERERESATLASALYEEARYRASAEAPK